MLAKKTTKNQITLPKAIVAEFEGIDYFDVRIEEGEIVLSPVRPDQTAEVWNKLEALGIRETDIDAAVRYARGASRRDK